VGESLEREGILIEVLEATETQVLRARLRRLRPMAVVGESSAAADDGGTADDDEDDAGGDSPGAGRGAEGLGEGAPAPVKSERGADPSRMPPGLRTSISAITTNRG
jgi:hypothetical protein